MRVMLFTILPFLALATCFALQSSSPSRPSQVTVHGTVTQDPGGQAVRKANIQLAGEGKLYSATSDVGGQFTIEGVQPGKYSVTVEHSGLVQTNTGRRSSAMISVHSGQETSALTLRMQPAGVITGKVVDADGDPISGVGVSADRLGSTGRVNGPHDSGGGSTNDLGEFRVPDLRPGRYTVAAFAPANLSPQTPKNDKTPGHEVYATTYYPGSLDKKQAVSVQVQAGAETPVTFGLLTTRAYRVSGSVLGIPTSCRPPLCAADLSFEPTERSQKSNVGTDLRQQLGEDATFEFATVLPGTYVARLTIANFTPGGDMEAVRLNPPVTVSDDSDGIRLQAERGGLVRGRLRLDNGQKIAQMIVLLVPLDEQGNVKDDLEPSGMGMVRPDGTFELQNVVGGTYQLTLARTNNGDLQNYIAKSIDVDGKDVTDSGFQVHPNIEISVVVSANGAIIEGTVVDDKGNSVAGASVADLPSVRLRTHPDLFQQDTSDEQGHFSLRGLRPGEYTVFAFEDLPGDFRQPEFLTAYEGRGEKVHLDEGTRKTVSVKLIEAEGDTP